MDSLLLLTKVKGVIVVMGILDELYDRIKFVHFEVDAGNWLAAVATTTATQQKGIVEYHSSAKRATQIKTGHHRDNHLSPGRAHSVTGHWHRCYHCLPPC